jgi:hypothetical protein
MRLDRYLVVSDFATKSFCTMSSLLKFCCVFFLVFFEATPILTASKLTGNCLKKNLLEKITFFCHKRIRCTIIIYSNRQIKCYQKRLKYLRNLYFIFQILFGLAEYNLPILTYLGTTV